MDGLAICLILNFGFCSPVEELLSGLRGLISVRNNQLYGSVRNNQYLVQISGFHFSRSAIESNIESTDI